MSLELNYTHVSRLTDLSTFKQHTISVKIGEKAFQFEAEYAKLFAEGILEQYYKIHKDK